jgi:hypothetical protein
MRTHRKKITNESVKRDAERLTQRLNALEKQFDLGLITEKECFTKRKRTLIRFNQRQILIAEGLLKDFNRCVRLQKLHLTRLKQDFLILLTSTYATKEIQERWEVAINGADQEVEKLVKEREDIIAYIKRLKDMLDEIKKSKP